jgi:omega-6 fatty acid desaturase (delta-12 desaturase)
LYLQQFGFFICNISTTQITKLGNKIGNFFAAIRGSSYYKLPKIFNFFTGNIGYHHIHHLAPKVPFYKLEKCSKENPIFQKHVATITLFSSIKYAFYTLWDEENYRMITFRQLKKLE